MDWRATVLAGSSSIHPAQDLRYDTPLESISNPLSKGLAFDGHPARSRLLPFPCSYVSWASSSSAVRIANSPLQWLRQTSPKLILSQVILPPLTNRRLFTSARLVAPFAKACYGTRFLCFRRTSILMNGLSRHR